MTKRDLVKRIAQETELIQSCNGVIVTKLSV